MTGGRDVAAGQVWRTRKYGGLLEVTAVDDKHVHALVLSVGTPPFFAYTVGTIQRFARDSWEQYHEPAADWHGKRGVHMATRRFELHRDHDVSGVSGTGVVADGVRWPDGSVSIRWRGERPSVVFWHSLADAEQVHGHGGATRFVWLDPDPADRWPVVKLLSPMPLAEGVCETCGQPLQYNLSANLIWHTDPALNDCCNTPFPANKRPEAGRTEADRG